MFKSYIHKFNALFISFVTVQGKTYPLSNKTDRMAGKGHFHALQNQEKRSIRAPETHKNPQECAYLQPIFQKYAKRHARKNRISCGKRGSACRKDEKCLPQGRKTPAAKCPQALRNGIFRNITGHLSSIRPPSAAFPIPTKRHENSIFPDTPRHAVHTASPPERQDVRQSPQTLDTSPSVRPARIAYPHPSPDTDANARFSESLRLTFCQTSPKASRAIPLAHLLKSRPAVRPALHLSPHHEMTIYSTVFKVIPPIFP